jgi:hypothetical protein
VARFGTPVGQFACDPDSLLVEFRADAVQ